MVHSKKGRLEIDIEFNIPLDIVEDKYRLKQLKMDFEHF